MTRIITIALMLGELFPNLDEYFANEILILDSMNALIIKKKNESIGRSRN